MIYLTKKKVIFWPPALPELPYGERKESSTELTNQYVMNHSDFGGVCRVIVKGKYKGWLAYISNSLLRQISPLELLDCKQGRGDLWETSQSMWFKSNRS
jgi:hypothetical protein